MKIVEEKYIEPSSGRVIIHRWGIIESPETLSIPYVKEYSTLKLNDSPTKTN